MVLDIARLLGPLQFNRYVDYRTELFGQLRAQATEAQSLVEARMRGAEARIEEIRKNILNRITPGERRVVRQQRLVGTIYNGSRTNSYTPPANVQHGVNINQLPANFMGTVAVRFNARRNSRGGYVSPGGTRYYEVNSMLREIPAFTRAQADEAIAERLERDAPTQAYRALQGRRDATQLQLNGFKLLG